MYGIDQGNNFSRNYLSPLTTENTLAMFNSDGNIFLVEVNIHCLDPPNGANNYFFTASVGWLFRAKFFLKCASLYILHKQIKDEIVTN